MSRQRLRDMEDTGGLCFEVKQRRGDELFGPHEGRVQYSLQMVGFLPVHALTTLPMLPWIVAEIRRLGAREQVALHVSPASIRCVLDTGHGQQWDPLRYSVVFEHRPQHVCRLIHNSHDPSYFACLIREAAPGLREQRTTCYVFRCADQAKVPEIINTLRQAGKNARQEEAQPRLHDPDDAFAKKFEVLFCGRVAVAHKKAPPALIDECIEKFNHLRTAEEEAGGAGSEPGSPATSSAGSSSARVKRSLFFASSASEEEGSKSGDFSSANQSCQRTVFFRTEASLPSLQALDENGISPELQKRNMNGPCGVQPTNIQENRTMLFTIGQSQIFIVSPDTKKVAIEKSFREISFCSQGIRHVDHFGFICRESLENGTCQFVCYVFQCTNEALVDEIMLTLKQAFSVAAGQQSSRTQAPQCASCPMQHLHRLCARIEGLHPSKAKLELQKHVATLNNKDQASIFERTQKARPKSEQEENELVMSNLRLLYEERQRTHVHSNNGDLKQSSQNVPEDPPTEMSSSRIRLEQLKSRAKKSLTESLEGIWKGNSRYRGQKESFESVEAGSSSSFTTLSSNSREPSLSEATVTPVAASPLKAHSSTGDLKLLESPSPDLQRLAFRRRANTFSHLPASHQPPSQALEESPSVAKPKLLRHHSVGTETPHQRNALSTSHLTGLRARLHSSSSVPNFLKFLAPVDENKPCDFKKKKSDLDIRSSPGRDGSDSPMRIRRHSWRQQIFLRVATPQKSCDSSGRYDDRSDAGEAPPRAALGPGLCEGLLGPVAEERKRTRQELRELWRKAILQQILLLRMEKENQKLQASESDLRNRRLKLDYEEITPCLKDVTLVWEKMLSTPGRSKIKFDRDKIHTAMGQGVPRHHRGEIWKFLAEQYQVAHLVPNQFPPKGTPYKELLKQLTSQQHAILIDLGRTFPTHPYFSAQLGAGQLSLYNLLKAYSLLDPEVGYCQGLSFVAGVLLLHMSEDDAFEMLKFLMYDMGLRKQYRPDMIILQIQMYQLSRLLHDYHRDLYNHLEEYEISPSLYAAPWFLTMFASQFPLGFVARVFDMLFLQGAEVIFKVALSLLGSHKPLILQHDNLEAIVDFIKTTLPNLGLVQMEKTINQVFEMDISKQLQAYEVEYHVLQDELMDSPLPLSDNQKMEKLEKTNSSLRQQNLDLLEELQMAHAKIHSLEARVENLVTSEAKLKQTVRTLELERAALLDTVAELREYISTLNTAEDSTGQPGPEKLETDLS
ncbi:TBC1 domain family member 1 isoform X3 [Lepisosteus oculatus]|uniref:TBC1 domain family member 1 isoform X3 n=1 Tax=Lepisosteus oculatus TaxID=7918 RepID=UPI0035F523F7